MIELWPWQIWPMDSLAIVGKEIFQRVLRFRGKVIIGAKDEETWSIQQSIKGIKHDRDGFHIGEEVTGADDEIRGVLHPRFDICDLALATRREVEVREMEDTNRAMALR
jgi:hypothetical protein